MRAALVLSIGLLAGCSVLFDGSKHRGSNDDDAGPTDAGPSGQVCDFHDECPIDPFFPICADPDDDGVKTCQASCTRESDCDEHPAGRLCVPDPSGDLCGCETEGDCLDPGAPFCLPAPDSFCVPCVLDMHCDAPQVCEDNNCVQPCVEDTGCGEEELCIQDRCVPTRCDVDRDRFVDDRADCPNLPPFDCNDDSDLVFPGALPDCASAAREACPGGPLEAMLPGMADIGLTEDSALPIPTFSGAPNFRFGLDVVIEPTPERAARVGYQQSDGTMQVARADALGVMIGMPETPPPISGWTRIESHDMARSGSEIVAAVNGWSSSSMVDHLQTYIDAGPLSPLQLIEGPLVPGVVAATGATVDDTRGVARTFIMSSPVVGALDRMGGSPIAGVTSHPPQPWLAESGGVVLGNQLGGVFLLDVGGPTTYAIPGTSSEGRGAIVRGGNGRYFAVVPTTTGLGWFAGQFDCATDPMACAQTRIEPVPGPQPALPAIAPATPEVMLLVVREGVSQHVLRMRDVLAAATLPQGLVLFDRLGPMTRIDDVAMDSYQSDDQLDVVIAAVVRQLTGPPEIRTLRIRACLPR